MIASGCGTQPRACVYRCCRTLTQATPSSKVSPGVPMDTSWLAGAYLRGVQVWEMPAGTRRWVGQTQQPTLIRQVAWSPDGTRLVGAGDDGYVYVWDARNGTLQQRLAGHDGVVMSVAWSPDGMRLATVGGGREGGELFVWDAHSWKRVQALAGHPGVASAVAWSPSGELLISGGSDGMLRWWEVQSGECVRVQEAHQGTVHALKVSPDGSRLASCGDDGAIMTLGPREWRASANAAAGSTLRTTQYHGRPGVSPRHKRRRCAP